MTLHPKNHWQIPEQTAQIARASFPKGNEFMKMYDELGTLYTDTDFARLFPARSGQSAISPAKLALITVMQFALGLTDRQAADAVRARIDWKYALGLDITDSGFDSTVLGEFRHRLCENELSNKLLDVMLLRFTEKKLIKTRDSNQNSLIEVVFDRKICEKCPVRNNCTSAQMAPRKLKLRPREEYDALQQRRHEQVTREFQQKYQRRAGIEGTISQAVCKFNLRQARYCGLVKTHLQHVATACAINLSRFFKWSKQVNKAQTRTSSFARLRVC